MLEKLSDPKFKEVSTACPDAMLALDDLMARKEHPNVAEIGVGIGATTVAMATRMAGRGHLYLFDFEAIVSELKDDLAGRGFSNISSFGNSRKTFDSYSWTLAKLCLANRTRKEPLRFDLVYLDGSHAFHHDAVAVAILKEMMAPDGLLLLDDYTWTFAKSPTMNPTVMPQTAMNYTHEQIEVPHVRLVCELLLDTDERFRRHDLSGQLSKLRSLYWHVGPRSRRSGPGRVRPFPLHEAKQTAARERGG